MDAPADWIPRHAAAALAEALADTPVVCLLGPRQSGKSTLARHADSERPYYTFDDDAVRGAALTDPAGFLASLPGTLTLDEIQRAPTLLPAIKRAVDRDRRPGRFLLTGSANLLTLPTISESLAGRMEVVRLHPLTEAEKARRPGRFLAALLAGSLRGRIVSGQPNPRDLVQRLLHGGFPEAVRRPRLSRLRQWHRDYLDALVQRDAADVANLRNLDYLTRLLALLAHQTASLLTVSTLCKHLGIRRETVENNLAALERLFLVRRLPGWHPNESRRLVKAPKLHLVDSGLAATLSALSPDDWNTQRERFGHLLESFVVQQLIAQAGWTDPDLRFWHYRDKDQVEVDLVITRGRDTWGVEVKTAASVGLSDGHGLRRLADQCGKQFRGGVVFYAGVSALPMGDARFLAVPLSHLWTM